MFAGSAAGEMMAPVICFKGKVLYTSWCRGGIPGTVYCVTPSGWFGTVEFELFFFDVALPHLKRLPGKKVLVGDNHSSHISMRVLDACNKHDISFVCLPPNSTDKLQPLDVALFGPLKDYWRSTVRLYKQKFPEQVRNRNRNIYFNTGTYRIWAPYVSSERAHKMFILFLQVGINRVHFTKLLKKCMEKADLGRHLPAGFEKCGLVPVSLQKALAKVPGKDMEIEEPEMRDLMNSALGDMLEKMRGVDKASRQKKVTRGKKLKVPAGQSYTQLVADNDDDDGLGDLDNPDDPVPSGSRPTASTPSTSGRQRGRTVPVPDFSVSSDEEDQFDQISIPDVPTDTGTDSDFSLDDKSNQEKDDKGDDEEEDDLGVDLDKFLGIKKTKTSRDGPGKKRVHKEFISKPPQSQEDFPVGSFVVAVYDREWYVCQVEGQEEDEEDPAYVLLRYMKRMGNNQFIWTEKPDVLPTLKEDILLKGQAAPIPVSARFLGYPTKLAYKLHHLLRFWFYGVKNVFIEKLRVKLLVPVPVTF